uniref:Uncharacterized protein n=1 Tax=Arundo donax TaxID=35708 RepID=A0A0A9E4T5_ARUDO
MNHNKLIIHTAGCMGSTRRWCKWANLQQSP